jgi:hypothetical protein
MCIGYGGSAEALAFFSVDTRVREWLPTSLAQIDGVNKHILPERTYEIYPLNAR